MWSRTEKQQVADIAHELRTPLTSMAADIGFARARRPELEELSFSELAVEAWEPLAVRARAAGQELVLGCEAADGLAGDPALCAILCTNLLANAVAHGAAGPVRVRAAQSEDGCRIEFSNPVDTQAAGDRDHLFHPFVREDSARGDLGEHSGLGLALVRRITEVHGATAKAHVAKDRFTVVLTWPT
ncbi:MAG: sensor histidine kinase [Planctomycetota bacterium]